MPDYRDEIETLVRTRFKTRREFCEATGLSEDMLSHVLAGRKNIAIDTLSDALSRIGCALKIVPQTGSKRPGAIREPRRSVWLPYGSGRPRGYGGCPPVTRATSRIAHGLGTFAGG